MCCGIHGVQDGLTDLIYVLLPLLAQSFGLNYSQVGMIRAANRAAMALSELPSGMISERLGERLLLSFGLVCVGAGYLALAGAETYAGLLLCLFVAGVGAGFQHSLSSSLICKAFKGARRRVALGAFNSAGDFGKLGIAGVFTLVVGMGVAWENLVAVLGALALVAGFSVFLILVRLRVGASPAADRMARITLQVRGWGLRRPTAFAVLGAVVFCDIAVQAGFLTFLAFMMIEKAVPVSLGALAVVLTLAGGAFGKLVCGFLGARLGVIRALVLVECLTAAGIVAVLILPALVAYSLLPLVGAALQGSSSITYATVGDLVEEERQSRGFAVIYSIANVAGIVAPLAFGLVGNQFGLSAAMLAMACVTLVPLPLCLFMREALASGHA